MSELKKIKVLMVDDEPNVLAGYRRSLGKRFDLDIAEGAANALTTLDATPGFSVVVTDMRMPNMDGIEFVRKARIKHSDVVYIMLTGNADQDTAVRAINEGQLFRFLNKPCSTESLEQALVAAIRQYEMQTAERVLLKDTLTGSIRMMADVMDMANPALAAFQKSVRSTAKEVCMALGIESNWQFDLASSLCLLGLSVISTQITPQFITDQDLQICAESGSKLLRYIPRLEATAGMIRREHEIGFLPAKLDFSDAESRDMLGGRILRFAIDLERNLLDIPDINTALKKMRAQTDRYDNQLLSAVEKLPSIQNRLLKTDLWTVRTINMLSLAPGMVLSSDVMSSDNKLLLSKGHELSTPAIERLRFMALRGMIQDQVSVMVRNDEKKAA